MNRAASVFARPVWVVHVFVVGLATHNLVAAELYAAGVRGVTLDVISAWKELLLAIAVLGVLRAGAYKRRLDAIDLLAALEEDARFGAKA